MGEALNPLNSAPQQQKSTRFSSTHTVTDMERSTHTDTWREKTRSWPERHLLHHRHPL